MSWKDRLEGIKIAIAAPFALVLAAIVIFFCLILAALFGMGSDEESDEHTTDRETI